MTPSEKSKQVEDLLEKMFGFDRRESIEKDVCVPAPIGCGKPATVFKDGRSVTEFSMSGLCQECQDHVERLLKRNEN